MLESVKFSEKIKLIYVNDSGYHNIRFILDNVNDSMSRYITLKTITSVSTGLLSYIVLLLLEIDFAFLINYSYIFDDLLKDMSSSLYKHENYVYVAKWT